ncbi:hypothetical protein [Aliikangiella coralliicola]|uniref:Uncharacterized protein n=1 Tax=Aliikangiella coralliicola TaxID=2592383 RepID=A0A545U7U4_9GAMM|nr:hypothetical protein [Aliikangiella coralliicola]TQV85536.1 hypothetical protein FLL46_20475 [Aliikangiella coralliicola]
MCLIKNSDVVRLNADKTFSLKKITPFIVSIAISTFSIAGERNTPSNDVAYNLMAEGVCSAINPGTWSASFQWTLKGKQTDIKLDITQYYNGWKNKQFETIANLKGAATKFNWSGGDPGGEYLWRIRAKVNGQWRTSETARYEVPVCPVDLIRPNDNKVSDKQQKPTK